MIFMKYLNKFLGGIMIVSICLLQIQCHDASSNIPKTDADNGGLFLAPGFGAIVVTDSSGPARHIAVSDEGNIYVKLRITEGDSGNVAIQVNQQGKAEIMQRFGDYPNDGSFATEMRIHKNYLYFSSEKVVYKQKLSSGTLVPTGEPEIVLVDDHGHGSHWHITKTIAFDKDDNMYIPFSAPSNACQDLASNLGGATAGVPGADPCPELVDHGGIWKFKANGTGLFQKDGVRVATGLRSVVAMDWNNEANSLFLVQHGRDDLHLLWPQYYSAWQNSVLPAEEFIQLKEGTDYGWPYSYYDPIQQKKLLAPEYGGDGKKIARNPEVGLPIMAFPAHWAPNDLLFYKGNQFPDHYKNGAFIAFHGSTNRDPYPQAGYIVCFVPFKEGKPSGDWEVFADGFAGVDPIANVSDAKFRPMGLSEGPDGSLYVVDSRKGKIWRIIYNGDKAKFNEASIAKINERKKASNVKIPDEVKDIVYKEKLMPSAQLFQKQCASCHQMNGQGDENRFPPIDNTEWVSNKNRLINIILNGYSGPIKVGGKSYNNAMPHHQYLTDEEIVEIIKYMKSNFNPKTAEVTKADVAAIRKK